MPTKRPDADAAIDRAVREIMAVEPRADMRRRVLERIHAKPARRVTWLYVTVAAVAAAAIAVAVMVPRQPAPAPATTTARVEPPAPGQPRVTNDRPVGSPVGNEAQGPRQPAMRSRGPVEGPPAQPAPGIVQAASLMPAGGDDVPRGSVAIDPIETINPIEVPALRMDDVATNGLTMHPIVIDTIPTPQIPSSSTPLR